MNIPKGAGVICMTDLHSCRDTRTLLEKIPPHVICVDIKTFDELCRRYKRMGMRFTANVETREINS